MFVMLDCWYYRGLVLQLKRLPLMKVDGLLTALARHATPTRAVLRTRLLLIIMRCASGVRTGMPINKYPLHAAV